MFEKGENMKKKTIVLLVGLVVLIAVCVGIFLLFGSKPPYSMSSQHEKYGRKALEIADAYLDFDITAEEAYKKISDLTSAMGTLPKDTEDEKLGNLFVVTSVNQVEAALYAVSIKNAGLATAVSDDVLTSRNELARYLGASSR